MRTTTLIGLGIGGVGSVAGTGVALSHIYGGETIKDHIIKESASNRKFISLVEKSHDALKKRYETVGASHKPTEGGKEVTKDQIIGWCERASSTKFSSENDSVYLSIDTWCFVNINTLSQQAGKDSNKNIDGNDGSSDGWKNAWETYNSKKAGEKLEITGDDIGDLNSAGNKDAGGPALYKWCNANGSKKMYEVGAEDSLKRYERWCFKP